MALRTVGVRLMAEVRDYIAGMKESEKATGDLVDDLQKAAKAGDESAAATEVFGRTARSAAQHVEHLDHEIKLAEKELRQLAVAFAEADTAAERADLTKGINKLQGELTKLKKSKGLLKDLMPDSADVDAAGVKAGKELGASVRKGLKSSDSGGKIGKEVGSSIISELSSVEVWGPAAAAMAPVLGALASAAVIGGAGIGGVIGGVMLAAKDPRVQAAGKALGENLLGELKKDANVFVEPVLKNIGKIEAAFHGMNDEIKHIFADSANYLDPLVNGALDGVHGVLKGVEDLATKGKPVIDQLGQSFASLGDSTGKALSTISGGSKPAARALGDLTENVGYLIQGIGYLVRGLTEVYGVLSYPWDKATDALFKYKTGVDKASASMHVASTVAGTFASVQEKLAETTLSEAEAAGKAGQQMQTYADAMDEAAAKGRSLYDSQTDVAQAFADAEKAVKQNGKTLDLNTQKGRDNRKALSDVASKLVATYDAYVKVNGEGGAAARIAANNRAQFIKLAESFGKSAGEASDLATQMGLLPANKKTNFYANTHDAQARIAALKGAIGGVHGKTVTVRVSVTGLERLDEAGHRIGGFKAEGGPVKAGVPYVVGEKRAEVFVPSVNGTIVPSVNSFMSRSATQAMPGNFGPQKVIVETRNVVEFAGGPDAFGQLMANTLRVRPGVRATIAKTLGVAS